MGWITPIVPIWAGLLIISIIYSAFTLLPQPRAQAKVVFHLSRLSFKVEDFMKPDVVALGGYLPGMFTSFSPGWEAQERLSDTQGRE